MKAIHTVEAVTYCGARVLTVYGLVRSGLLVHVDHLQSIELLVRARIKIAVRDFEDGYLRYGPTSPLPTKLSRQA